MNYDVKLALIQSIGDLKYQMLMLGTELDLIDCIAETERYFELNSRIQHIDKAVKILEKVSD